MTCFHTSRLAPVCIRLGLDLVLRNFRKYAPITIAIFIGQWGIERWRVRLVRASYFYFRYLDDVTDGERGCESEPELFLDRQSSLWRAWSGTAKAKDEATLLLSFMRDGFIKGNLSLHRARFLALRIIDGLRFDLERRAQRRVVRRAELDHYYEKVVLAPARLAHFILDAEASSVALHEISGLIGRLQSLRDLRTDLVAAVINIPLEDLEQMTVPRDIAGWRQREIDRCATQLRDLWKHWPSHADERSQAIMRPAVRTLLRWAARSCAGGQAAPVNTERVLAGC